MYPAGGCSERWTSRVARPVIIQIPTLSWEIYSWAAIEAHQAIFIPSKIRLMCQVLTHCGFSGVSPDGNCAYVHWGSLTSNTRSVRRAIWFTWFSEPHECQQHLAVPGGHPSNYQPGATLLNFSDRANHDGQTPYSVYMIFFPTKICIE